MSHVTHRVSQPSVQHGQLSMQQPMLHTGNAAAPSL